MAVPPVTPPPVAPSEGTFRLKNLIDIPDDTVLYDNTSENPIAFVKNVIAQTATPNPFRTRKQFYGRFVAQLYADGSAGKTGAGLFDPAIAGMKAASGEAASADQMKLFVCIVHIEELQHYPFPAPEDWDAMQKIASSGGVFKSYAYAGQIPNYGDNVLVAYADPATRTEGMFLQPLVGGVAGGASASPTGVGGGGGGGGGSSINPTPRMSLSNCGTSPPIAAVAPAQTTVAQTPNATPQAAALSGGILGGILPAQTPATQTSATQTASSAAPVAPPAAKVDKGCGPGIEPTGMNSDGTPMCA